MKLNATCVIVAIMLCVQGPSGSSTGAQSPSPSSNGLIALTLRDQNRKLQIFTENPNGSNQKQLTFAC
jgi:hypothetical protein